MPSQQIGLNLLVNQRYYHFIILRVMNDYSLANYWQQFYNDIIPVDKNSDIKYPDFEMQHRRLKSNTPFSRGRPLEQISATGNGMAPYHYDMIAIKTKVESQTYCIFAFPFVSLGRYVTKRLMANHDLMKHADILKVDLASFVEQKGGTENVGGSILIRIVGLRATVINDPTLNLIALDGEAPLKSTIYQDFLQESISSRGIVLERCVQSYELLWPLQPPDKPIGGQRKLRAKIHINSYGYFKFYIYAGGENCSILPYLVERIDSLKCLSTTSINPFNRIREEDEQSQN